MNFGINMAMSVHLPDEGVWGRRDEIQQSPVHSRCKSPLRSPAPSKRVRYSSPSLEQPTNAEGPSAQQEAEAAELIAAADALVICAGAGKPLPGHTQTRPVRLAQTMRPVSFTTAPRSLYICIGLSAGSTLPGGGELPNYLSANGWAQHFPELATKGWRYQDLAAPGRFKTDPGWAWGFHRQSAA